MCIEVFPANKIVLIYKLWNVRHRLIFWVDMSLHFSFVFFILACQSLPLQSTTDELPLKEYGVRSKYSDTKESTLGQNELNSETGNLSKKLSYSQTIHQSISEKLKWKLQSS